MPANRIDRDKATAAKVLQDLGWTLERIGELFGTSYGSIRRWIEWYEKNPLAVDDSPKQGPTELAVRALVATWGETSPHQRVSAEVMLGHAVVQDVGRGLKANGAERTAAVAAGKELKAMLAELGQSSGFEDLRKALLGEDNDDEEDDGLAATPAKPKK